MTSIPVFLRVGSGSEEQIATIEADSHEDALEGLTGVLREAAAVTQEEEQWYRIISSFTR